uniref:Endonuclease/exonuclease/phosphatase domain-containing protein n=1 Tax=Caenorhabditis japonica TaxID=281687 RepID=A0A8R1IMT0_CAEJA
MRQLNQLLSTSSVSHVLLGDFNLPSIRWDCPVNGHDILEPPAIADAFIKTFAMSFATLRHPFPHSPTQNL